jgi:LacI family transcriptional regulator, galactose operon repressor
MKDIARDLGVSVVTISKVLRNHSDIGEDTRRRVLNRMKELNYFPNYAARALVTGRTMIVGLIVPDLVHPFFAEAAKGLSATLRNQGYGLLIASSEENVEIERSEIEQLLARKVDAIIIASAQWSVESFRMIEERKTPYVLLDRRFVGLHANFVGVDDELVGKLATEHLISRGGRRIAHIRGPEISTAIGRFTGYRRALEQAALEASPDYVVTAEKGDEAADASGFQAMARLLTVTPLPDAVFCFNDPSAAGAMSAILQAGLRIPEDIAIMGCGNTLYDPFLRVPLSSIDQSTMEIGRHAADLALFLVQAKTPPEPRTVLLEPRVIARKSTDRY